MVRCPMPGAIKMLVALLLVLLLVVVAARILGGARTVESLAQTAADPPLEHKQPVGHDMGPHNMGGQSDRGYHRAFDNAERWAKEFDDPARDAWQKPDEVLDALHLERTARVADLGAGTGYFSARIAKRVPEGKVFAIDVEPDMLRYLRERAQREHLGVLVPVLASAETPNIPEPVDASWSSTPITISTTALPTL